jgi:hypothetical protein
MIESAINTVAPGAGQSHVRVISMAAIARRKITNATPGPRFGNVPNSRCIVHIQMKGYPIESTIAELLSERPAVVLLGGVTSANESYTGADLR